MSKISPSMRGIGLIILTVLLIAIVTVGITNYFKPASLTVACTGINEVLPPSLRQSPEALIRSVNLTKINGVIAVKYPEPRGVQINPWNVARYGLLEAVAYCHDHDASRLPLITTQRDWLLKHLKLRHTQTGKPFLVTAYDFPVAPWTSKPGWVSALSQSAALAFLDRTTSRYSFDRRKVGEVARAFVVKNTDGGIYSDFGNGGIVWQEYATPEKTSDIIGGHAAIVYIIAHELHRLSDFPDLQARLTTMVAQGQRALVEMLPFIVQKPGKLLYDFHGVNALRDRDYTYWLILDALKWIEKSGKVSPSEVQRFAAIEPFDGPEPPRPTDH